MTIEQFNKFNIDQAQQLLFNCCGSTIWSTKLAARRPFHSIVELKTDADKIWLQCEELEWRDAFLHHPKIGDIKSLAEKFASTKQWASGEQSAVNTAAQNVLTELKGLNDEYEKKFGFIFIVCATGKSAAEILLLLKQRLPNNPEKEIKIAANEQNKITHLRIDKLFS